MHPASKVNLAEDYGTCWNIDQPFKSAHTLFEDLANEYPNETAVISNNKQLTYSELDKKSNQVARYLQKHGVQSETLVGLSLSNGLDLIIGILGVLKAGGVYLPLEPSYPRDRIEYMLNDAKPSILLTESSFAPQFANFSGEMLQLDKSWKEILAFSDTPLKILIDPRHLAYIIYTSGSTGKPKGIMVEHGGLAHGAVAHQGHYQGKLIGLLSGAISFDVSILIIFHLLTSGGTIYLPPSESTTDANKLIDIIESNAINYILCVPSLYSIILEKSKKLPSLKIVSLAGETIPNAIIALHPQFAPNAILYNEYGPTEYAIGTTIAKLYDPGAKKMHPISVGKPLPKTLVYVLDENLKPVPSNTKGEIFIGGAGIARGYLNKPQLTAEKFICFQSETFYRTGDFGRFLPNGDLEFLGRMDYQIKLRGHRIELGEIEHVISQHPQINEAIVVVREEPEDNKYLAAYFTTLTDTNIKQELKAYLTRVLPKYMVPSAFVQLKSFARTPNGKIDRNALPNALENTEEVAVSPLSTLEKILSDAWKKVLHVKSVSTKDNFFDLGGDSLGIARIQTVIETLLAIKISVIDLLQHPTIAQLAQHLNQRTHSKIVHVEQGLAAKKRMVFQRFKMRTG